MKNSRNGFTLVELAIVLAIVGLLIGGIMAGKTLQQQSRVNKTLSEAQAFSTAKFQFLQQYNYLPGDFPSATTHWGRMNANADCVTNTAAAVGANGACDGNGNGRLQNASAINSAAESFQFWKHLVLAGYIAGTYTGLNGPGSAFADVIPGTNSPETAVRGGTFWYRDWGLMSGGVSHFAGDYTNTLVLGGRRTNAWNYTGLLGPDQAMPMDTKVDDGLPGMGNVRTLIRTWMDTYVGTGCISSDVMTAAAYQATNSAATCILLFLPDFQAPQALVQ